MKDPIKTITGKRWLEHLIMLFCFLLRVDETGSHLGQSVAGGATNIILFLTLLNIIYFYEGFLDMFT